jgi:hypothetical protein
MMNPALKKAPQECTSTSWIFDVLEVHVPYGKSDVGVTQHPIGSGIENFVGDSKAFGHGKPEEETLVTRIRDIVAEAGKMPSVPKEIPPLTKRIEDLLKSAEWKYDYYADDKKYRVKGSTSGSPVEIPWLLSREIDTNGLDYTVLELAIILGDRDRDRDVIRDRLLEAAEIAWCVLYATNQARALALSVDAEQKRLHDEPRGFGTTPTDPPKPLGFGTVDLPPPGEPPGPFVTTPADLPPPVTPPGPFGTTPADLPPSGTHPAPTSSSASRRRGAVAAAGALATLAFLAWRLSR